LGFRVIFLSGQHVLSPSPIQQFFGIFGGSFHQLEKKKKKKKTVERVSVACVLHPVAVGRRLQLAVGVWPQQSRMLLFFRVKP
jgi:hypothetical protein